MGRTQWSGGPVELADELTEVSPPREEPDIERSVCLLLQMNPCVEKPSRRRRNLVSYCHPRENDSRGAAPLSHLISDRWRSGHVGAFRRRASVDSDAQ